MKRLMVFGFLFLALSAFAQKNAYEIECVRCELEYADTYCSTCPNKSGVGVSLFEGIEIRDKKTGKIKAKIPAPFKPKLVGGYVEIRTQTSEMEVDGYLTRIKAKFEEYILSDYSRYDSFAAMVDSLKICGACIISEPVDAYDDTELRDSIAIQPDWDELNPSSSAFIKNKPQSINLVNALEFNATTGEGVLGGDLDRFTEIFTNGEEFRISNDYTYGLAVGENIIGVKEQGAAMFSDKFPNDESLKISVESIGITKNAFFGNFPLASEYRHGVHLKSVEDVNGNMRNNLELITQLGEDDGAYINMDPDRITLATIKEYGSEINVEDHYLELNAEELQIGIPSSINGAGKVLTLADNFSGKVEFNEIFKQKTVNLVADGGAYSFNISISKLVSVVVESNVDGLEIPAIGVVDPTSVSNNDTNLSNDNYSDLCYNNSSTGSNNKELPGLNLGNVQPLGLVKIFWYLETYTPTTFRIEQSSDGISGWTDISGIQNGEWKAAGIPQRINVSGNYQYIRVFSIQGNNPTYTVLTEMEAFSPSTTTETKYISDSDEYSIKGTSTSLTIINNSSKNGEFKINHF